MSAIGCATSDTDDAIAALEAVADAPAIAGDTPVSAVASAASIPECPGVPYDGIDSYAGFAGYYTRTFPHPADELVTLQVRTVEPDPEWIGVRGNYDALVRRDGLYLYDRGRYVAVPNNPAIGPAIGFDRDGDDVPDELYWVLGETRNLAGKIDRLCLGKSRDDGSGKPFLLTRLGW